MQRAVAEDPTAVLDALDEQLSRYRNPPMGLTDLLGRLKPFVPGFVDSIAGFAPDGEPGASTG